MEVPELVQEWIAVGEARILLKLATKRFGPAPADTEAAIRAITKPDRLERMVDRVESATGWADILATT